VGYSLSPPQEVRNEESVQEQVQARKVKTRLRVRHRFYQFTAIDEATRFRVLRIYDLREVREHFPSAIQKIQTDNDSSFGPQFTWHLSVLRISHRHISPGCKAVNGKVERSNKTDSEEFYRGRYLRHKKDGSKTEGLGSRIQRGSTASRTQGKDTR